MILTEKLKKIFVEWRGFFVFIVVMLLFRSAIADWNQVPTGSMKPSILDGDRIVVDKLAYDLRVPFTLTRIAKWSDPQRGDIVTFPSPVNDTLFVKRVVGIPSDIVELRQNQLYVNGIKATYEEVPEGLSRKFMIDYSANFRFLRESLLGNERIIMVLRSNLTNHHGNFPPTEVPVGQYMMMGDNRDFSSDSRSIGFIERTRIIGRAYAIAFSVDYDNFYLPRFSRFFRDLL